MDLRTGVKLYEYGAESSPDQLNLSDDQLLRWSFSISTEFGTFGWIFWIDENKITFVAQIHHHESVADVFSDFLDQKRSHYMNHRQTYHLRELMLDAP